MATDRTAQAADVAEGADLTMETMTPAATKAMEAKATAIKAMVTSTAEGNPNTGVFPRKACAATARNACPRDHFRPVTHMTQLTEG
jgi:hypothetical protein